MDELKQILVDMELNYELLTELVENHADARGKAAFRKSFHNPIINLTAYIHGQKLKQNQKPKDTNDNTRYPVGSE